MKATTTLKRGLFLSVATLFALCILGLGQAYAAGFKPVLSQVSADRPITFTGYLNTQGVAFDTYTKTDGYNITKGSDGNKGFSIVHFTMDAKGNITQRDSLIYPEKNIVHGNDATIYKSGNTKYLFFAVSGGNETAAKTTTGKRTKIGVIKLDDFNKGVAKVYGVKVKAVKGVKLARTLSKAGLSGITYVGKKSVDNKKRDVFVLKDGVAFYQSYITVAKSGAITFTIYNSARINKPQITLQGKKYDAATQGVTYHNGYLYLTYSGESE
mgnify:CR=1 FL=1